MFGNQTLFEARNPDTKRVAFLGAAQRFCDFFLISAVGNRQGNIFTAH